MCNMTPCIFWHEISILVYVVLPIFYCTCIFIYSILSCNRDMQGRRKFSGLVLRDGDRMRSSPLSLGSGRDQTLPPTPLSRLTRRSPAVWIKWRPPMWIFYRLCSKDFVAYHRIHLYQLFYHWMLDCKFHLQNMNNKQYKSVLYSKHH